MFCTELIFACAVRSKFISSDEQLASPALPVHSPLPSNTLASLPKLS